MRGALATSFVLLLSLLSPSPLLAQSPLELRFQFTQNGLPSIHAFVLKWASEDGNLQTIDVQVADTKDIIQSIAIPQDRVSLIYRDVVNVGQGSIKDKFIDSVDYDFDNFADLRLTRNLPYKVGEKYYLVWLFDEEKNQYILHEGISELPAPTPSRSLRQILTTTLGGYGGGEFVKRGFSVTPGGKLTLQSRVTQTIRDATRFTFGREVRTRVKGELQRTCKIEVPTEGKLKLTWGDKGVCEPFLVKDM